MYQFLTIENIEGVGMITFNRPKQLNAMNRAFMDEIVDACTKMNEDTSVKVVVITGSERAFMAGADIKEYAAQGEEDFRNFQVKGIQMYKAMEESHKPYIAMVNGFALGGGFEIACACDLIVASEDALMGLPEIHLGLIPGGGGTQRLIQKIGINRVKEMLYLGGQYSAIEMKNWGIVNFIFPEEILREECLQIAHKLGRKSSNALAQLKRLANISTSSLSFDQRISEEGEAVYQLFQSPEAKEKIDAFMKKNNKENE